MANNTLYPGYVVLYYTWNGIEHKATLPCSGNLAGTQVPSSANIMQNNGVGISATQAVINYVNVMRVAFNAQTSIDRFELFSVASPTSSAEFVFSDDVGIVGSAAAPNVTAVQLVAIARTSKGGIAKPTYLECATAANSRFLSPSYGNSVPLQNLSNWFKGDTGWVIGRDGGRIVQITKYVSKTNDLLRKRRLLV